MHAGCWLWRRYANDRLCVIELGQLLAGPFAGSRLADFGAEVIKIEVPRKGDAIREWGRQRWKQIPLQRLCSEPEVSAAVTFLLSGLQVLFPANTFALSVQCLITPWSVKFLSITVLPLIGASVIVGKPGP